MPTTTQRKPNGVGRGPSERASFALGSALLDRLATRAERTGSDMSKQVRFLVECLLDGKLLLINGVGEIVHLSPQGGVTPPCAVMEGSPSSYKPLPKLQLPYQLQGGRDGS